MARVMPPRWRRKKPDTPGLWALWRAPAPRSYGSTPFMVVRVTDDLLASAGPKTPQSAVDQWSADWWMPLPDVPGWNGG